MAKVGSAKSTTTKLPSPLYAYLEVKPECYVDAALSGACLKLSLLPEAIVAKDRRDFEIVTLLWHLGLRAGEVARLEPGDIDWETDEPGI
ncbi:MAG: hypothetical protein M1288_05740 [Actinobacteria bacterium]|jgi:hypothetical protein|nr:hypothetical protein [Actinomycetota bacterium]